MKEFRSYNVKVKELESWPVHSGEQSIDIYDEENGMAFAIDFGRSPKFCIYSYKDGNIGAKLAEQSFSFGQLMGEKIRQECNKLSDEQREELIKSSVNRAFESLIGKRVVLYKKYKKFITGELSLVGNNRYKITNTRRCAYFNTQDIFTWGKDPVNYKYPTIFLK